MHSTVVQLSRLVRCVPGGSALVYYAKSRLQSATPVKHDPVTDEDFLKWMRFINPGMLNSGNLQLFAYWCCRRCESAVF
jgi:hypothetical protein